jgi:Pyridoxamine 5'-phosphate oxidase
MLSFIGGRARGLSDILRAMATWTDVETAAPELAKLAQELFEANKHLTIATLRRDGSPRISGIECRFIEDDLWFGSMPDAVKARDLQRDPRFALHSGTGDANQWKGDAKVAGRVEEITDPARRKKVFSAMGSPDQGGAHLFRAELTEVSTVRLGEPADHLIIDSWREGEEPKRIKR